MSKKVELREITSENFDECIKLKVSESQTSFVASNVKSIAQSKVYPTANPMAIYADDEMVGFTMFGLDEDDGRYYLIRLMIDEKHQGQGFGKLAANSVIEKLRGNGDCQEVFLSFVPENVSAEKLYQSIGFVRTGEISNGEVVMKLIVQNNRKSQI